MKRNLLICALLLMTPSFGMAQGLEPIEGGRTFYFTPNGGPVDGVCDGSLTCPWANLQNAYDYVRTHFRLASGAITFKLADGVYPTGLQVTGPLPGQQSPHLFRIIGNVATPSAVVIRPSGTQPSFVAAYSGMFYLDGVKMDHVNTMQDSILIGQEASVILGNVEFGYNFNPYNHISVQFGGYLEVTKSYTISGGAQCHILMGDTSKGYYATNGQQNLINVAITGNPEFYVAFLCVRGASSLNAQAIGWNGAARGRKFLIEFSALDIGGTEPCDVPGNQPGRIRYGGQLLTHPGDFVQGN